ncbi:hypothetical protein, partial [Bradyrhizobium sp. NBAIM32]|uniref:hypothetical protein n=1 Tax=Bradyrhizobium sp. NBAIM32 TaxID=2793809 RepID=UPI001CD431DC
AQHPTSECRARFRRREHAPLNARPEAVDQDTGRAEAGQLDDGCGPEFDQRPERHPFEVRARIGDVLAELSGSDLETSLREGCEELEWDQVDLPQVGKPGSAPGEIACRTKGPAWASPSTPWPSTSAI